PGDERVEGREVEEGEPHGPEVEAPDDQEREREADLDDEEALVDARKEERAPERRVDGVPRNGGRQGRAGEEVAPCEPRELLKETAPKRRPIATIAWPMREAPTSWRPKPQTKAPITIMIPASVFAVGPVRLSRMFWRGVFQGIVVPEVPACAAAAKSAARA